MKKFLIALVFAFGFSHFIVAQSETLIASAEAENGTLVGGLNIAKSIAGYSGTGYVTNFRTSADKVLVKVSVPTRNYYKLVIRYATPSGKKNQKVYVNNSGTTSVVFNETKTFSDCDAGKYLLNAGENTITLESEWGWIEIDKFSVYTSTNQKNTYNIVPELVNPKSTPETKALYSFLISNFNKKIISGQTNSEFDKIRTITGKTPLLRAFDFQHFTQGYPYLWNSSINGHSFGVHDDGQVNLAISWYNQTGKKGIVSFQWHWHSPTGGKVSTNTFYSNLTTFDVTKAITPGTSEYTLIIEDIDAIAIQLKKLQAAGVPVIWRPLHEAGGAWFWWGAKGAVACKKLYDIMFERMTNYHGLNNLIWTWSTPENDWYPGNDKIDIVGHDSYPGKYVYDTKKNDFEILYKLTNGTKIIAMTENGPIPEPDDCLALDAPWSYFMSWSDLVFSQNINQHIINVYNNPKVLTLENVTTVKKQVNDTSTELTLYPNPAKGRVTITANAYDRLEVIDMNGKIVFSTYEPIKTIRTDTLINGIYIFKIYSENESYQQKLIISN